MFLDEQPWQKVVTFNSMLPTMWKQHWEKTIYIFLTCFWKYIKKNKFWPNLTKFDFWSNLVKFGQIFIFLFFMIMLFIFFVLKQFQRWKSGHNLLSRLQSRQHPMLIPWIHSEFESGKPVPQMVSYQLCFILEWILGRNGLKYKIQKHLWLLNPLNKTKFKLFLIKIWKATGKYSLGCKIAPRIPTNIWTLPMNHLCLSKHIVSE